MSTLTPIHSRAGKWLVAIGVIALIILLWTPLKVIFTQIIFAVLICLPVLPLLKRLEKKMPPAIAALLCVLCLLLMVIVVLLLLVPQLVYQISLIIEKLPSIVLSAQDLLRRAQGNTFLAQIGLSMDAPEQFLQRAGAFLSEQAPHVVPMASKLINSISRAFLAPVLAYYFLRDREMFLFRLSLLIPLKVRNATLSTLKNMRREAMYFVRGQLLIALCVFLLTSLGLFIVGLPAFLALGLIMGICELIPYVGPIIGAVPILIFSLPMGLNACFWSLMVAFIVQQLEGAVISPRLMGGATGLHPVWVLLLLTFGGLVAGLPGMVFTLPIFLSLRAALRTLTQAKADLGINMALNSKGHA